MTHQSIYISDQGELLLVDAPEKPQYHPITITNRARVKQYEAALASAIAKGVRLKDQHEVKLMLAWYSGIKSGQIFPLPTGYKVSLEEDCQRFKDPTHLGGGVKCSEGCYFKGGGLKVCEKLAILSKLEEHPLQKLADKMQNIEPEFQEVVNKNWDKLVAPSEEVKLPKSKEFIQTEPAARALYFLLERGESPTKVLDEAISYYSLVLKEQDKLLLKYIEKYGVLE